MCIIMLAIQFSWCHPGFILRSNNYENFILSKCWFNVISNNNLHARENIDIDNRNNRDVNSRDQINN